MQVCWRCCRLYALWYGGQLGRGRPQRKFTPTTAPAGVHTFENKVVAVCWRCRRRGENKGRSWHFLRHKFQRSINEVSEAASPPSYRCATCRRWGTSGSDSTGICCGISCECDSEDHSVRIPTLTWLCVWRNPKRKKRRRDVCFPYCDNLACMLCFRSWKKRLIQSWNMPWQDGVNFLCPYFSSSQQYAHFPPSKFYIFFSFFCC